jgi:hypothetical protein
MDDRAHGRRLLPMPLELFACDTVENLADDIDGLEVCGRLSYQAGGSLRNLVATEDHLALVGEMPEERSRREARPSGDLRNRRCLKPLLGEQLERRSLESAARVWSPSHETSVCDDTA